MCEYIFRFFFGGGGGGGVNYSFRAGIGNICPGGPVSRRV